MKRLEGKIALISGTARGLGKAAALRFAAEGALVVGGDLLHDEAVETQRQIGREGGTALTPGPLDVTRPDSVGNWVAEAAEAFGGVDIVLTSADSMRCGSLTEQPGAAVLSELDAVRLAARATWPHLTRSRGCIVTIGPAGGIRATLSHHRTFSSAAEAEVCALTRRLATEGSAHGIRANSISPAPVDIEGSPDDPLNATHPLPDAARRTLPGTPGDIARIAAFLASDEASCVSGAHLVFDGGWSSVLPGPLT
ncbi:SDR family NAD(P)-dependent oxidoreductase [Streptomyces sp. NPDC086838]|uniref:SDR family NAD(P)-dependent oxidoreductase n=1 Tax=Streptomyces sp. NPDC086838 TaxID=3365762 RepID=UPI0037FF8092